MSTSLYLYLWSYPPCNCSFDLETQQLTDNKEDVSSDAGINYKLVPETVELLESITKPVAVLSICGPYRSGKSYFLSRMLGRKETFKLGHTMEACTRGMVWMASSVLECDEFVLLLLDTEGIDAADKSNAGVANLLVLTMLLSSTFVYNSTRVPRGRDLKKDPHIVMSIVRVHVYIHDHIWRVGLKVTAINHSILKTCRTDVTRLKLQGFSDCMVDKEFYGHA